MPAKALLFVAGTFAAVVASGVTLGGPSSSHILVGPVGGADPRPDPAPGSTAGRPYALRGTFVTRGGDAGAALPGDIHVVLIPIADGARASGTAENAGQREFIVRDAFGPRVLRVGYTSNRGNPWHFAAVLLNGVDVTDVPMDFSARPDATLEIVFDRRRSAIDGVVSGGTGQSTAGAWIVVMSANPALWRATTWKIQADRDGRFAQGIRRGHYLLAALPATPYQIQPVLGDLGTLAAKATPVSVGDGARVTVNLSLR